MHSLPHALLLGPSCGEKLQQMGAGQKVLKASFQGTWKWVPSRQNFRDLGPHNGGHRLLEEPWPAAWHPQVIPGAMSCP